jgi:hypothetical protein
MNKTYLLLMGLIMLAIGLIKPDLSYLNNLVNNINNHSVVDFHVDEPSDLNLKNACEPIINIMKSSKESSKKYDAQKLSSLYRDIASLIQLDAEDLVIKSTLEIREANKLAGLLSKLNLSGRYPELATECDRLVVIGIGDEDVVLDNETRKKSVDTFNALSWAFYMVSK